MTMKRGLYLGILVLGLSACITPFDPLVEDDPLEIVGSGRVTSEVRAVGDFTKIDVQGGHRVVIERWDREGVEVRADDNLLRYIETEVRDGTLFVRPAEGVRLRPTEQIIVHVQVIHLRELRVSGAVTVDADLGWNDRLAVEVRGASTLTATGATGDLAIEVSGASQYLGEELESRDAEIDASGASHVHVWASETLDVAASGASQVLYRGNPSITSSLSGAAAVSRW